MSLVTCNDCGKQISPRASACPSCGAPLAPGKVIVTKRAGGKWEAAGFLLILAGFFAPATQTKAGIVIGMLMLPVGFVVFLIGRFK